MQILFVISSPDVFKSPTSETYVIFGEAKIEDLSAQARSAAAETFRAPAAASAGASSATETKSATKDSGDDADAEGVEEKDIELVIEQAKVSRAAAIKALKNNNSDIVNAIMELTM